MTWEEGAIEGCEFRSLKMFKDDRGWLAEFFRSDEVSGEFFPAMGYLSLTKPGVTRGPHEHRDQADYFIFYSGAYRIWLWDSRESSPTFRRRQILEAGEENPSILIVPAGVVHAYRNEGGADAISINCPNRLYAGEGKKDPVDEIRHEDKAGSEFQLD